MKVDVQGMAYAFYLPGDSACYNTILKNIFIVIVLAIKKVYTFTQTLIFSAENPIIARMLFINKPEISISF